MKRRFRFSEKGTTAAVYVIMVFAVCLVMVFLVFKWRSFASKLSEIISVFSPIIWGVVIAYLLNPVVCFIEKHLRKLICKKKEHPKTVRAISITLTMILVLAALFALVAAIVPQLIESYMNFSANFSGYWENLKHVADKVRDKNPEIYDYIMQGIDDSQIYATALLEQLSPRIDSIIDAAVDIGASALSFVFGVADALCGLLISVYLMFHRETLLAQLRKMCYGFLPTKKCDKFLEIVELFDRTIIDFLSGKILDSLIIGVLCFIGVSVMKMPFAVLISVIVAVTNIIPFFGPIIGAIPCILLILLTDPFKAIWFAIFILILQQFDGNVLGPKILGNKLGLPTFWTLFAILIGGGLFGFFGMVIFIPIFAVFYKLLTEHVGKKLTAKNLPSNTSAYVEGVKFSDYDGVKAEEKVQSEAGAQENSETADENAGEKKTEIGQ